MRIRIRTVGGRPRLFDGDDPLELHGCYRGPMLHTMKDRSELHERLFPAMKERGLNFYRCASTMGLVGSPWIHPYEQNRDGRFDLNRWNEAFFEHWRKVLQTMYVNGIYSVFPIFGAPQRQGGTQVHPFEHYGFTADYFFNGNNVNSTGLTAVDEWYTAPPAREYQLRYLEKILNVAAPFGNLIFETANEALERAPGPEWSTWMAGELRRRLPADTPIMPVDLPEHRELESHRWPGQNALGKAKAISLFDSMSSASRSKVIVWDNDHTIHRGSNQDYNLAAVLAWISHCPSLLMTFADGADPGPPQSLTSRLDACAFMAGRGLDRDAYGQPRREGEVIYCRGETGAVALWSGGKGKLDIPALGRWPRPERLIDVKRGWRLAIFNESGGDNGGGDGGSDDGGAGTDEYLLTEARRHLLAVNINMLQAEDADEEALRDHVGRASVRAASLADELAAAAEWLGWVRPRKEKR